MIFTESINSSPDKKLKKLGVTKISSLPLEAIWDKLICYCLRQFVLAMQVACLRQEETLPYCQISGNFSPINIGLNATIFTPVK